MIDQVTKLECGCTARKTDLTVIEPCAAHEKTPAYKVSKMWGAQVTPEEVEKDLGLPPGSLKR